MTGDYELVTHRSMKIGKGYLVISEQGSWVYLTKEEFGLMQMGDMGCELFEKLENSGIIATKSNFNELVLDYAKRKRYLLQGPSLHIVAVTTNCNQNCVYCQQQTPDFDTTKNMDADTAKSVVDFIFSTPSPNIMIEFQGGEPLVNMEIIRAVVEYAREKNSAAKKNLRFSVVTNLGLMSDEILDFMIRNNIGLCTSLDGPEEVHNANRPYISGQGSHGTVTKWIDLINERVRESEKDKNPGTRPSINALITVTRNLLPKWEGMIKEYAKHDLAYIDIRPINKIGMAKENWETLGYTVEEFLDFWTKSLDMIVRMNDDRFMVEVQTLIILRKILTKFDPLYSEMQSPCGGIISQLAYDYKGDIYTCDEARTCDMFRLGNVKNDAYGEIVRSPKAVSFISASTNDVYICDSCIWKPYCGICPVCNYHKRGSIISTIPGDERCEIRKRMFAYIFEKYITDDLYRTVFDKWVSESRVMM